MRLHSPSALFPLATLLVIFLLTLREGTARTCDFGTFQVARGRERLTYFSTTQTRLLFSAGQDCYLKVPRCYLIRLAEGQPLVEDVTEYRHPSQFVCFRPLVAHIGDGVLNLYEDSIFNADLENVLENNTSYLCGEKEGTAVDLINADSTSGRTECGEGSCEVVLNTTWLDNGLYQLACSYHKGVSRLSRATRVFRIQHTAVPVIVETRSSIPGLVALDTDLVSLDTDLPAQVPGVPENFRQELKLAGRDLEGFLKWNISVLVGSLRDHLDSPSWYLITADTTSLIMHTEEVLANSQPGYPHNRTIFSFASTIYTHNLTAPGVGCHPQLRFLTTARLHSANEPRDISNIMLRTNINISLLYSQTPSIARENCTLFCTGHVCPDDKREFSWIRGNTVISEASEPVLEVADCLNDPAEYICILSGAASTRISFSTISKD